MNTALKPVNLQNKSILIVEDDLINFEYLRDLLLIAKAKIIHAVSGEQAMQLFDSQKIDAVLLDIKIPPPDGLAVAKHIRNSLQNNVPIIAQTACAFKKDKENCLQAGCDEFIAKPFPVNLIFDLLDKHLN